MAKRKLSKQQKWRIEKIQEERSARARRKERSIDDQLAGGDLGPEQAGLIIAHHGQQLEVEALEGERRGDRVRCFVRANIESLVTGDQVVWRAGAESLGVIVARSDRSSLLQRPDKYGQLKPVAANIDHIILVLAPEPEPHDNLIDRYLVAAENTEIPAVLLFNKTDLIGPHNAEAIDALLNQYESLGYPVVRTSALKSAEDDNLDPAVDALVRDQTSVFVGQSGVGKSSIIDRLLPGQTLKVGAVSESTGKGIHTTTTARLFHIPGGGRLIDSPGIREFGLWHMTAAEIEFGFRDIRNLTPLCRFRNCRHESEPGCALDAAIEQGQLSAARLHSFRRIMREMEESDVRAFREE